MRLLVYPHSLEIGGSQLNAIEVAADIRDRGHQVTVFAQPGPLQSRIDELSLPFIAAPTPRRRPSPPVIEALRAAITTTGADIVHAHEWPPALESYIAAGRARIPVVSTVMSMSVAGFLPADLPVLVGTAQMAAHERDAGRQLVGLVEPSVDVTSNRPGHPDVDTVGFRRRFGLDDGRLAIVVVTRLAHQLKLEGIVSAIEAMTRIGPETGARLVVVGDGPAADHVAAAAATTNRLAGDGTVVLTGSLSDPRPAYTAADVSLGMGGSALRAMAHGTPLVVQGEQGYFRRLEPGSADEFLWVGWYGVGASPAHGPAAFEREVVPLLTSADLRRDLGSYARRLVLDRFSVQAATTATLDALADFGIGSGGPTPRRRLVVTVPAAARYVGYWTRARVARARGRAAADDFNARPVAGLPGAPAPAPAPVTTDRPASEQLPTPVPPGGTHVHDPAR